MSSSEYESDSSGGDGNHTFNTAETSYASASTSTNALHEASASSHEHAHDPPVDRRKAERKKNASTEEGKAQRRAKRSAIIEEKKRLLAPQIATAVREARTIRVLGSSLPSSVPPDDATDAFVKYLNLVRGVSSSKRYALAPTSPHLKSIFDHPASFRVLTILAKEGYLFNPSDSEYSGVLVRQAVPKGKTRSKKDKEAEEEDSAVTFKFYTRATPSLPISQLVNLLKELDTLRPNHTIWTQVNVDQLAELAKSGETTARLFYHGYTAYSIIGRELDTQEGEATLVAHWKELTGEDMEVYHWAELDREGESRYVFRTDESISGIEEVIVDAAGGILLNLNQIPGGFLHRILYHPDLVSVQRKIAELRTGPKPIVPGLQTSSPAASSEPLESRQQRVRNLFGALSKYCQLHSDDFSNVVAEGELLQRIASMAAALELEGVNVVRAILRKDIPREALIALAKLYIDAEVGRGARNDKLVDEEAQGLIDLLTGLMEHGVEYEDRRFPFMDLWCIVYRHPDWWIVVFVIVLVFYIHILKPKYVVIGAAKLAGLIQRDIFSSIFKENALTSLQHQLDTYFSGQSEGFTSSFLANILEEPLSCPATTASESVIKGNSKKAVKARELAEAEAEARELLLTVVVEWDELPVPRYITWVGIPMASRLGPLLTSFYPTVGVLDGGFHAYHAWTRHLSMQLSQATQLMVDLVELVTSGIEMDGTEDQAQQVVREVERLSVEIGLKEALESIRKELLDACTPLWSLARLAVEQRKELDDFDEDKWDNMSARISAAHQNATANAIVAIGKPGSPDRIAQANQLVQDNRDAINARKLSSVHPCPGTVAAGPGSAAAWLWYALHVRAGATYLRAANGTTLAGKTGLAAVLTFKQKQLIKLKEFREKQADQDAALLTKAEAIQWLQAPAKGTGVKNNSVFIVKCVHCHAVAFCKNYGGWRDRLRHACPVAEGDSVDLDGMEKGVKELEEEVSREAKALAQVSGRPVSDRTSFAGKLERFSPDGKSTSRWTTVKDDDAIQRHISDIKEGLLAMPGKWNPAENKEKHGRLDYRHLDISEKVTNVSTIASTDV